MRAIRDVLDRLDGLRVVVRILPHLRRGLPGARWNAARLLAERARIDPCGTAVAYEGRRTTWGELDRAVDRYARALRSMGVAPGDVVALLMDNRPEYLLTLTALSRLRAVAALINTSASATVLAHALTAAGSRLLVVGSEHAPRVAAALPAIEGLTRDRVLVQCEDPGGPGPAEGFRCLDDLVAAESDGPILDAGRPRPDERMCLIYTSGTTGLPKAAVIKNSRFLLGGAFFGAGVLELRARDVVYVPLPLYHTNALLGGWSAALATGACIALRRKFSAKAFWNDIRTYDATAFLYIGELCRYLLNQPPDPADRSHHLRIATGNGLRPDIWPAFQARFRVPLIREFYGATEGNVILVNLAGRPGMVGRLTGNQVIVRCDLETGDLARSSEGFCTRVEVGETGLLLGKITLATPFDGYVDEQATHKKIARDVFKKGDAYFDTGDLMVLHAGGWVSFADRLGDTFRWKGENVSTTEVAGILNGAPGVTESVVYGVRVPGSEGRAGMVALTCDSSFSIDAFGDFVRDHLPSHQRPYFVRLLEEMAITGTFKQRTAEYRASGYDPARVGDPLYVVDGQRYVPLDAARFQAIETGTLALP